MRGKLNAVLTYFGLGAFVGFLFVFFGYAPDRGYVSYLIPLGAVMGTLLGLHIKSSGFRVAPVSSVLGAVFTLILVLSWICCGGSKNFDYSLAVLALLVAFGIGPSDLGDAVLGFSNYVGGFAVVLLSFRDFLPFQEVEGGLFSVIKSSGRIAVFLVSGALMRWGLEQFRNIPKDNV